MDLSLEGIESPALRGRRYDWDNAQFDLNRSNIALIEDPQTRKLVDYFHLQYHEQVVPVLPVLRRGLIHNDANDYNILVQGEEVCGIIDFGDLVHSPLINELAIALAYALLHKEEPLKWAGPLVSGYAGTLALQEAEIQVLYWLIATRLCISLCHSARARREDPDNEYLFISEKPVVELLHRWIAISPIAAGEVFREAAGMPSNIRDTTEEDTHRRWSVLGRNMSLSYRQPLKMERAAFQYMFDSLGNTFLDLRNNIPHVGHCHPRVVRAGQQAMARLNTNTRYLYDEIHTYSERLLACFPEELNRIFYVNSGSAASDLALRLARTHTRRNMIMTVEHAYHGNTGAVINASPYKFMGKGGQGRPADTLVAPIAQDGIEDFLVTVEEYRGSIAAFLYEPIVSAAGQVTLERPYLEKVYAFIRNQGGVCISDEVQTGFGRPGSHFWAYEATGLQPDIVILGKPIANGHPMAAVVCTGAISESFNNGMEFFSSFGGNPVSCAIAGAVLDVMEEEHLMENALEVGTYLIGCFEHLRRECPRIGRIGGSGLTLGVEILDEKGGPGTELASRLVNGLRERGILVGTDGPFDNALKIKPPLCFTIKNADVLMREIRSFLFSQ